MYFLDAFRGRIWAGPVWMRRGGAYRDAARLRISADYPRYGARMGKTDRHFPRPGRLSGSVSREIYGGYGRIPAHATRRAPALGGRAAHRRRDFRAFLGLTGREVRPQIANLGFLYSYPDDWAVRRPDVPYRGRILERDAARSPFPAALAACWRWERLPPRA